MPQGEDGTHADRKNRPNRRAKDSVFTSLFRDKAYLLQLYQALHPEDMETGTDDLDIIKLENIMAGGIYNDLGFQLGDLQADSGVSKIQFAKQIL